jgi:hypothetical protein
MWKKYGVTSRPQMAVMYMRFACLLTIILLTWRIGLAPNNASRWKMGYNLEFKGLN